MLQTAVYEKAKIKGIPLLRVIPKNKRTVSTPTVFIYHGWFSKKENYQFVSGILASYGYQVIVPDLPLHGERSEEKNLHADFWRLIIQAVQEFPELLRETEQQFGVVPSKTILFGSSTGGFLTTGIFAQHPNLKGLICVNGSGAWEATERLFREADGRPPASEEELKCIRLFDPINYVSQTARPILLQHGLSDSFIPIEGQVLYYEALIKAYGEKSHLLTFEKIPRMDHYISLGMFESMILWMNEVGDL